MGTMLLYLPTGPLVSNTCSQLWLEWTVVVHAGAGKTYTMLGKADEPGIMGLTLTDLFTKMEENKEHSQYHVTMAYLEVREVWRKFLIPSHSISCLYL